MGLFLSKKVQVHIAKTNTTRSIVSVHISDICQRAYPCKHSVTVTYSDGEVDPMHLNGVEILKKFNTFLTGEQKDHFQVYDMPAEKL